MIFSREIAPLDDGWGGILPGREETILQNGTEKIGYLSKCLRLDTLTSAIGSSASEASQAIQELVRELGHPEKPTVSGVA